MNNRPVEQALATLLPTHADDLPPQLLSLAVSLVAQSRSYSTSLKPEEEIARPYACAEIACKRLSRVLKLPPLLGHPPCPPRVYKKLFAFLDRSLTSSMAEMKRSVGGPGSVPGTPSRATSKPSTPRKELDRTPSRGTATTPRGLQNTPSKSTPLKRAANGTPKQTAYPQSAQKTGIIRPNGLSSSTIIPDASGWVMTNIRTVCKVLSTPAPRTSAWSRPPISRMLPPHIFAGVSSILYFITKSTSGTEGDIDEETLEFLDPIISTRDRENDEEFKELVNALIVAVYFLVLARRRNPSPNIQEAGNNTPIKSPLEPKKLDKKTFADMRQTALVSLGLPLTERRHREDVDQWIAVIMELDWANGKEWFENIPMAGDMDGEEAGLDEEDSYGDEDGGVRNPRWNATESLLSRDTSRGGLLPGLGTMMQDRVDWLSPERQEDYFEWKADIMQRIKRMERAGRIAA